MAWHINAMLGILGEEVIYFNEEPECGWFKTRLTKGGPFVPARIWLEQTIDPETGELCNDEVFRCEINGQPADPYAQWGHLSARPISEADFNHLTDLIAWSVKHAPGEPMANLRDKVDWRRVPVPQF